jgi:SSS family solute:Na+ symporter
LLAAYVSTISTHLNWGTSYLVHDLYRRFLNLAASERHYVAAGRLVTALLMVAAGSLTLVLESARGTFNLLLSIGAGTGLLYLLRWFWWRINAWSEVAAMASSFIVAVGFFIAAKTGHGVADHISLIITVAVTTLVWVAVTYLAKPTNRATLVNFYRLVRPAGPGWNGIREESGVGASPDSFSNSLLGWVLGIAFIYSALFGTGSFIYGKTPQALMWVVVFVVSLVGLVRLLPKMWSSASGS